jgi:FkbM family methyltransferase
MNLARSTNEPTQGRSLMKPERSTPLQQHRLPVPGVSLGARLCSGLVLSYLRYSPIERGKWRLLRMANRFLVVRLAPGVFIQVQGMSHVEKEIAHKGIYEAETVELFLKLLGPGMTVLDVGANVGQYALLAAERVGPSGRVHAFEPTPHVAAKLRSNIRLNGFDNVTVSETAVNDSCGEAVLYYAENDGENNILAPEAGSSSSVRVATVTLDEYLGSKGIDQVDVVKMDIEGAEVQALRGASRLLTGDRAPVLFVEVNPGKLASGSHGAGDLVGGLRRHGYEVYVVAHYGVTTHDPWANAIAFKPAHQQRWPLLQQHRLQPVAT